MKKLILPIFALLLSSTPLFATHAQAKENLSDKASIFLTHCNHFGTGVSYQFQNCVNMNFQSISRVTGGFYSHCNNFGKEVDFMFTNCVNNNFREAQRRLNNAVYVQNCMNFDRRSLDFTFINCTNNNFREIQREISRR